MGQPIGLCLFLWAVQALLAACASIRTSGKAGTCPLATCENSGNGDAGVSLLEASTHRSSLATKAHGCGPKFVPAHFTCTSCDKGTCKGCNNVICDLSKCVGKFFNKQCWCNYPATPDDVNKYLCDDDCTGGLCNGAGLKCSDRSNACKPWWWCKLPPPKEPPSFLQRLSARQGACGTQESAAQLNERFGQSKAESLAAQSLQNRAAALKERAIDSFKFSTGSFVCGSAMMPPPEEDPVTLREYAPGFIVFDGASCSGGFFEKNCFCYDKFLYLRGKDPKTSELKCNSGCDAGPCGGKTCGDMPPPPLPAPAPPPVMDPLLQEELLQRRLDNMGVRMSPVK